MFGLNHSNINLDRKILANLAINEPFSFKAVVDEVKIQNSMKVFNIYYYLNRKNQKMMFH